MNRNKKNYFIFAIFCTNIQHLHFTHRDIISKYKIKSYQLSVTMYAWIFKITL